MKKSLVVDLFMLIAAIMLLVMLFTTSSNAQSVGINNGGAAANSSAMLDVSSTTKGMLIPRMRTNERIAIVSPAEGLLVYDIDTKGFWYYSNNMWNEVPKGTGGGAPSGPAGGDLSGNYPTPNVVKIQNLDVAFGVPFDKQVMKWDMLNNKWQGQNDSLFLPYNSTFGSPAKLFGITNTNTSNGATAIYGKSGNTGSGINPGALTIGVWGDNSSGPGVMGTSSNHVGTYGYSVNNHGTFGFTSGVGFAGVYGGRVNTGPAVMGEVFNAGYGIYGKSNGATGKAALFESVNASNTDTVVKFSNKGTGVNSYFINDNSSSSGALINAEHFGTGTGIYLKMWNAQNNNPGLYAYQYGNGDGLYVGSNKSKVARFYANGGNADTALTITHDGTGTGLQINLSSGLNTKNAVDVLTAGTGNAAKLVINNSSNSSPAVSINTNGTGRGLQSIISNVSSLAAAIYGSGINKGVEGIAQNYGVYGQATAFTGGIGVLGQSSLNSSDGIGVKGASYSNLQDRGAVTGENLADGVGVYGSTATANGIGIKGSSANTSPDQGSIYGINTAGGNGIYGTAHASSGIAVGVKGYGTSGQFAGNSIGVLGVSDGAGYGVKGSINNSGAGIYGVAEASSGQYGRAAQFQTWNTSATVEAVNIYNSGLAEALEIVSDNASNTGTMVRIRKWGTGDYMVLENSSGTNLIRFSNTGKGFFNGGTQTGGADMAEAFDVTGNRNSYETGDVLVISKDKDRAVEKSSSSYSMLVAGVYATRPGVLMTEENIDTDISAKVPMGVLGVIPTKVCSEGGEIKRGDLLVTSSLPGVAMKADIEKIKPGQVLGKALENFNGSSIGKIKVLVSVK